MYKFSSRLAEKLNDLSYEVGEMEQERDDLLNRVRELEDQVAELQNGGKRG